MRYSLLLLAAASLWCAEDSSRTIEKSFPLTGAKRSVSVCGINGAIKVTATDSNEVRFSIREELSAPTRERLDELKKEVDVSFLQEPGSVLAGVKSPWSGTPCGQEQKSGSEGRRRWDGKDTRIRHDFTVSVPRDARLQLKTVNGAIEVTATAGAYSVHTVNGAIRMTDVEGAGDVNTVNGTVVATYKKNPAADTKYRTVNGKVDLYYQPGLSADFSFKTVNGKAFTDFDMTAIAGETSSEGKGMKVIHRRGNSGQLRAGNGGPKISAETVNGSILIHDITKGRP